MATEPYPDPRIYDFTRIYRTPRPVPNGEQ
jgi:hypothetical protein